MKIWKAEKKVHTHPPIQAVCLEPISNWILVRIRFLFCFQWALSKLRQEVDRAGDIIRNIMYISSAPAAAPGDVKSTTTTGARAGTVFCPDWLKNLNFFLQMSFSRGSFFLFSLFVTKWLRWHPLWGLLIEMWGGCSSGGINMKCWWLWYEILIILIWNIDDINMKYWWYWYEILIILIEVICEAYLIKWVWRSDRLY